VQGFGDRKRRRLPYRSLLIVKRTRGSFNMMKEILLPAIRVSGISPLVVVSMFSVRLLKLIPRSSR
jgi:hypothetical protein